MWAVLNQYARAFELMDVQAIKAVRPSMDTAALRKSYESVQAHRMRLANCQIEVSERTAHARCRGDYIYTGRVGSRREVRRPAEWTFDVAQSDDRWQIVGFTSSLN